MADQRSFTAGRFALSAGDINLGYVKSVKGGSTVGELATHNTGPDNVVRKHISNIKHEAFTLEVGAGMGKGFYEWMRQSFEKSHVVKDGSITAADFDYRAMRRTDFFGGLITEVGIPALDGSSKDPIYLSVKIEPERLRHEKESGAKLEAKFGVKTKRWVACNFRVDIGDLPCSRVSKVDAFKLTQKTARDQVGQFREATLHPTHVEVDNIKLTISSADSGPWETWFRSFVIDGNCSDSDELTGSITLLGPNHKDELGRIELSHIGIIKMEQEAHEANKDSVARFIVELYVEEMKLMFDDVDA